jgi:hypothetical protein
MQRTPTRPLPALGALCLAAGLLAGCVDRGMPTSPAERRALFSSVNGLDHAGFKPFVSFGTGCQNEFLGADVANGLLIVRLRNQNVEVSKEELFAGPATIMPVATINLATGELVAVAGTGQHRPSAVTGTWEVRFDGALIKNGKLLRGFVSGVGTGQLEGLGIQYEVVINAKASTTPPHLVCEGGQPFLTTGKIFRLD